MVYRGVCARLHGSLCVGKRACAAPAQPGREGGARESRAAGGRYYIEFRAASIGTYGHTYVAYGRLDARGRPINQQYADLHPMGGYAGMALGHVVPVPGNETWNPDVLKLPINARYRRTLNAAEYQRVLATVRRLRASKLTWNAVAYNCNDYVAEIARAVGLRTPSTLLVTFMFVPALRDMNEPSSARAAVETR